MICVWVVCSVFLLAPRNFSSNKCWSNSELNLQQTKSNARWRSLLGCSFAATYSKCLYALSILTTTIRARTLAHTNTRNNFFSVAVSSSFYLLLLRLLHLLLLTWFIIIIFIIIISYVRFFICCVFTVAFCLEPLKCYKIE